MTLADLENPERLCPYNGVNSKIVLYLFLGGLPFLVSKRAISA